MITYTSDNREYTIDITSTPSLFQQDRVLCKLTFKDSINSPVLELTVSEMDILNLIDNIYAFLYTTTDILYTFQTPNKDNITYVIQLVSYQNTDINTIWNTNIRRFLSVLSYKDDIMNKILTFEVTNSLDTLCDILYEETIEPIPDPLKKELLNL